MKPWHYLLFLFALGAVSRLMMDAKSPGLIDATAKFIGNLFKGTINN